MKWKGLSIWKRIVAITHNGFGLAEGGEFEILMLKFTIMFNRIPNVEAWDLGFCLGNTVKYISRAGKKETDKTVQDLEKAKEVERIIINKKTYIERKIK